MSKHRSTRSEQFSAKIHGLREIYKRLDSKTLPLPTGNDVANFLTWFQDVLQGIVKEDRPKLKPDKDCFDSENHPSMAYADLYHALVKLARVVPVVELGGEAFAKSILSIMASLIPFLPKDQLNSLPLTLAINLATWPETMHFMILNLLCGYVMPTVLYLLHPPPGRPSYASLACPSLIMTVLQHCPDSKQQAQFVEALMQCKPDVCMDLLAVVAYGPQPILNSAGQILLHYFPLWTQGGADDWQYVYESWFPSKCQNKDCSSPNQGHCAYICYDACYAAKNCDIPPPAFICAKCNEEAEKELADCPEFLVKTVQPLGPVPTKCQGPSCKGQGKPSAVMCFSPECATLNRKRGAALCQECNVLYHENEKGGARHVVQTLFPDPWSMEGCDQAYATEAVVRLLREAKPCQGTRCEAMGLAGDVLRLEQVDDEIDNDINNRRMLSRFGIWLLVGICSDPTKCESPERLGRLVAMVIAWIDTTSSLMRDYVGELLKRLASQHASKWLSAVRDDKMELFCACISPSPPEYARVGTCWDALTSTVRQYVEGLHRICCLIPFDLLNIEVWETVMPLWMDAIKADVPPEDLPKFKVLLCKLFDPLLSPFKWPAEISLGFVKKAVESSNHTQLVQGLSWLQMLSTEEVIIKVHMLTNMFLKAIQSYTEFPESVPTMFPFPQSQAPQTNETPGSPDTPPVSAASTNMSADLTEVNTPLSSFILMLDLLVKQVQLQFQRERRMLSAAEREEIKKLINMMLDVTWTGAHGDHSITCQQCEMVAVWFKLAHMLLESVFPPGEVAAEDTLHAVAYGSIVRGSSSSKGASFRSTGSRQSVQIASETIEEEVFFETVTANTNASANGSDSYQGDLDSEGLANQGDGQTDSADSGVASMRGGNGIGSWRSGSSSVSWNAVFENNPHLQLLIGLLKELPKQEDHIVQLNVLKCLQVLVLRGDYLRVAMEAEPDFLAYLQEIFFIPNLWELLQAEHSDLSEIATRILLHCICLPYGAEKLCDNVESAFTEHDWRVRFAGVEKVTVLARFLEKENVKSNNIAMSALAQCFTFLVGAVEDVCTPVSTRAIAMLDTIKASALKILYSCIEHQYDAMPKDRLLLIHTCRILHRILPHYTPLCGMFFIGRFKHLLIENADYVSFGSPKIRSSAGAASNYVSPSSEVHTPLESVTDSGKRPAIWRSQSGKSAMSAGQSRSLRLSDMLALNRQPRPYSSSFRCSYIFTFSSSSGESISYNKQPPASDGNSTGGSGRQRRTGGFGQMTSDLSDRMFLGGRVQNNLPTVIEEGDSEKGDKESQRLSHASEDSSLSQEASQAVADSGNLEAAATHQLVTLVMDFLAYPGANKNSKRGQFVQTQSFEVVTMSNYLGVLMGYDIKVGEFTGDPRRLRSFPVFHAYMSGIVQVLDQNQEWGGELLNLTLQLLLFCAAPRPMNRTQAPDFTLIRLPPPMRRIWLLAVLIILYKYPFHEDSHRRDTRNLIAVVLNTLESQNHKCPGPRSAQVKRQSLSLLDLDTLNPDDGCAARPDTPSSPRARKFGETSRTSPTNKERLSTGSSADLIDKPSDDEPTTSRTAIESKSQPFALHETSFVGPFNKPMTSTPMLELSPTSGPGGSNSGEEGGESRPLIDGGAEKKLKRVSIDSTSSKDTKESVEGILSLGLEDTTRKPSRPKLLTGMSFRSMDRSLEKSLDRLGDLVDKEPELQDIDLDSCPECGASLEEFEEETLNLSIVVLSTYVHQSPSMAMPYLLKMLECVGRKCVNPIFPWQDKSDVLIPGSTTEVAKQFLRCVLIKLAPNGIFSELFRTAFRSDDTLLKAVAYALNDFSAFDQMSPIAYLLEDILGFRTLGDRVMVLLANLATYFKHASKEPTSAWQSQLAHFENFFRKLPSVLPENSDFSPAFHIMSEILTAANSSFKVLLQPFSVVVTFSINKGSFHLQDLLDLCSKCNETFPKERDKLFLTRAVVTELMHAVRFRSYLPDLNLQSILQFLAIDAGSRITFGGDGDHTEYSLPFGSRTRAMDCMQPYYGEAIEFIRDWNFTSKSSNENRRLSEPNLNFDTVPIHLKASVAQLAALELTKQPKSGKLYTKALSWLKSPPTPSQLGPKELLECVSNMRLLTWLLHGSLSHMVHSKITHANCQPISLDENIHIADYVLIILFSFAEPLKESLNVTALYHAFHLCELWTLYCDYTKLQGEYGMDPSTPIVLEFWGKVTPGILHLLTKAKEMSDLVGHNFLNLLEALQECNCTSLPKLYPMWHSILTFCFSLKGLSEGSHNRLRKAQTRRRVNKDTRAVLARWLKQLQFKIALAEQSAANGQTQFFML
ncbi:protein unc-79 homolog isoform X2 [Nematostella vectensis]|uniref:protein unc-79 homolog isoform X2 n=1 Tax=Nematostella vectensis TaxID=45351 RepID=UPI00207712E4|nr:protein unc-79 homolog isoform X2 [Nematostella vectensis]